MVLSIKCGIYYGHFIHDSYDIVVVICIYNIYLIVLTIARINFCLCFLLS